jgi:hypothetical protein
MKRRGRNNNNDDDNNNNNNNDLPDDDIHFIPRRRVGPTPPLPPVLEVAQQQEQVQPQQQEQINPFLVANPRNSPETERLNQRLATINEQEARIRELQSGPASALVGIGAAGIGAAGIGAAGSQQTQQQQEQYDISTFADDIVRIWPGYEAEFNAIIEAIRQRANAGEREDIQQSLEQVAANHQYFINTLFQGLSSGASGILLGLIVLGIFTNDSTNSTIIQNVFGGVPLLSTLFQVLSQYIVRPFVNRNLINIQSIPDIVRQGYTNNQIGAILSMVFTGMSAYGVNSLLQQTGPTFGNTSPIVQLIRASFPVVTQCISAGLNVGAQCGANLVRQLFSYMRIVFVRPNSSYSPSQDRDRSASDSSEGTINSIASLSTANSRQIGSVVANMLDEPSVTNSVREVFQNLSNPDAGAGSQPQSTVSSLSQQIYSQDIPRDPSSDMDQLGGRRRRKTSRRRKVTRRRKTRGGKKMRRRTRGRRV